MGNRWVFAAFFAAFGALGLSGCPTVDLGDTPPDIGQPCELVAPEVLVQKHAMDE